MDLVKRRSYLGGTDIAVICGLSPYKTPYELWQEKTSTEPPVDIDNDYMALGRVLEDGAAQLYADKNKLELIPALDEPLRHPSMPFLACNYDRLFKELENPASSKRLMEVKTTVRTVLKSWKGLVPDTYWCQIQHYLGILSLLMGINRGLFVVLVLDERKVYDFEVDLDQEYVDKLWNYAEWWWNRHVVGGHEPEYTAKEYDGLKELPGSSVVADDQAMIDYYELLRITVEYKALEARKESLEARLKTYIKHSDALINPSDSSVMATYRRQTRKTIDGKRLKADHPHLFELYQKESHTRILRPRSE